MGAAHVPARGAAGFRGQGDYYGSGTRVGDVVNGTMSFDQSNYKSDTSQEISTAVHNFEQTIMWMTVNKTGTYSANGSEQTEQWDPEIVTSGGHHIRDFNEWWCQVEDPTDCGWRPDPNNVDEDISGGFPGSPPPSAGTGAAPGVEQGGGAAGKGAVRGIGQPGFWGSLVPIYGSGRAAIDDCQNERYGWCAFNAAMAVSDVFMVGGLIKGAVKGIAKVGAKLLAREAAGEACSLLCCFTAGHQIVVLELVEPSQVRLASAGESDGTESEEQLESGWNYITVAVAAAALGAALGVWWYWPKMKNRRSARRRRAVQSVDIAADDALDYVLAEEDVTSLRFDDLAVIESEWDAAAHNYPAADRRELVEV